MSGNSSSSGPGRIDRAGQVVPAARLGLLDDRDRHLAEALHRLRVVGEQLQQAVGAGQAGGAAADDRDADLDPLVLGVELALDELVRRVDRRRIRRRRPAVRPLWPAIGDQLALLGLHGLGQLRQDLVQVADDAEVGELEDRGVRVLVDRDDVLRGLHADLVLDRARDARREVQLRRDGLARLADLRRVRVPAGVDDRAGRGDGGVAAERAGQRPRQSSKPSALPRPRPPAIRMSAPSMSTSAPRCSPRCDHRGLRRPGARARRRRSRPRPCRRRTLGSRTR